MIGICYFVLYKLRSFISDRNYYIFSNTFDAQCKHQCYHTYLPASGAAGPGSGVSSLPVPRAGKKPMMPVWPQVYRMKRSGRLFIPHEAGMAGLEQSTTRKRVRKEEEGHPLPLTFHTMVTETKKY
jgi:hypothetical protein